MMFVLQIPTTRTRQRTHLSIQQPRLDFLLPPLHRALETQRTSSLDKDDAVVPTGHNGRIDADADLSSI